MEARTLTRNLALSPPALKKTQADRSWPLRASLAFVLIASLCLWGGIFLIGRALFAFFASGL